jgi:small-conductance mechanosensitive channel
MNKGGGRREQALRARRRRDHSGGSAYTNARQWTMKNIFCCLSVTSLLFLTHPLFGAPEKAGGDSSQRKKASLPASSHSMEKKSAENGNEKSSKTAKDDSEKRAKDGGKEKEPTGPSASKQEMSDFVKNIGFNKKRLVVDSQLLLSSLREKEVQLLLIKENFPEYEKQINDKLERLVLANESAEIKFYEFRSSLSIARHSPYGYSLFYGRLIQMSDSFSEIVESSRELLDVIDDNLENLEEMRKSMKRLSAKELPPELKQMVVRINALLDELHAKVKYNKEIFSYYFIPVKRFDKKIRMAIDKLRDNYTKRLPRFFLNPYHSIFSREFWKTSLLLSELEGINSYAKTVLLERAPSGEKELLELLLLFLLFWVPFYLFSRRRVGRLSKELNDNSPVSRALLLKANLVFSLSVFFFVSAFIIDFPHNTLLKSCAFFLSAYAAALLIRAVENLNSKELKSSPVPYYLALFLVALILEMVNCPIRLFSIIWIASLLIVFPIYRLKFKKTIGEKDLFNTIFLLANATIGAFIVISALMGYVYLSHLLYKILFLSALAFKLSRSMTKPVRRYADSQLKKRILYGTALKSLGIPVLWLASTIFLLTYISNQFGDKSTSWIYSFTINWNGKEIGFSTIVSLLLMFFVFKTFNNAFRSFITLNYSNAPQKALLPSIQHFITYSLWILFLLLASQLIGINLSNITLIIGGISMGVGFGLRDMVTNLIGGVVLIFNKELRPSDIIHLDDGTWAQVQSVNFRSTVVKTFDNAIVSVPNSKIMASKLTNWSLGSPEVRRQFDFTFKQTEDLDEIKSHLMKTALSNEHVLKNPPPTVLIKNFNQESVDLTLHVWLDSINNIDEVDSFVAAVSKLKNELMNSLFEAGFWELPEKPDNDKENGKA